MATRSIGSWARLQGTIHHPLGVTFPRVITVANRGSRSPLPMVEYRVGWAGWQKFAFSGRCEQGYLSGELSRTNKGLFLRHFGGELKLNNQAFGTFVSNTGLQASVVAGINSTHGTFFLVLRRARPGLIESDLIIDAGDYGPIAEIFGAPRTRFIGRVTYGQFIAGFENKICPTELRAAVASLLAIYFFLIQPMSNGGSS